MTEVVRVDEESAGTRLDAFVARTLRVSRAVASDLIDSGGVVAGTRVRSRSFRLPAGMRVRLPPRPDPERPVPLSDEALTIVFVDDRLIVVDKPARLVVHPGAGERRDTLAGRLLNAFPELSEVGDPERPGIVHRLDRDTSGLLVVARTNETLETLQQQLRAREVGREYVALVTGDPPASRGTIDAPIGADPRRRGRIAIVPGGRDARTHYTVVERWERPACARLHVTLETGRTHQIRVHLAASGMPVVGDVVYGGGRAAAAAPGLRRPFLHAARLTVPGYEPFESPLPDELVAHSRSRMGAGSL